MSPARKHRETFLASLSPAVDPALEGGLAPSILSGTPQAVAAAQMKLRLRHDLQRLKQIQSIQLRIAAKREMLPEYEAWIAGLLAADHAAAGDEVLPTIMVWYIDVAEYAGALDLAEHILAHDIPMPARYDRAAPTILVEEIAEQALKAQVVGAEFPLAILESVEGLTHGHDMHDQARAKLAKAIGTELARIADNIDPATPAFIPAAHRALEALRRAQLLNDRVGVKDKIKRLDKALAKATAPVPAATEQAGEPPAA